LGISDFHEPELYGERHELLLGAVVQVPFEPPSLLVLGVNQSLARRAKLFDQPDVPRTSAVGTEIRLGAQHGWVSVPHAFSG
jgi:hypothetical protein